MDIKPIPIIFGEFISNLVLKSKVISYTLSGGNTTLHLENSYHARTGMFVLVDGVSVQVVAFDAENNIITVTSEIANPLVVIVPNPFYFHGTPLATSNHISKIKDAANKFPMVYLYQIFRERIPVNPTDPNGQIGDLILVFLDNNNIQDWETKENYTNVIIPLRKLINFIIGEIKKGCRFGKLQKEIELYDHVNWGIFAKDKGHIKSVFSENLSGVEVRIELPIDKNYC